LQIDFANDIITDLDSSNGTYINRKSKSTEDRIAKYDLNKVEEFNLARDITFSFLLSPDQFKGFHCLGLSTKYDNTPEFINLEDFRRELTKTWFIYLPVNKELYVRKYDGEPAYENSDKNRNYQIRFSNGRYYFSDREKGIKNKIITTSKSQITMQIEER
jgi:hypothetical protein